MAFCKYCGRQLADGEVCGCPASLAQASERPNPQTPPTFDPQQVPPQFNPQPTPQPASGININLPNSETVLGVVNKSLTSVVNILRDPASAAASFVQEGDLWASLIFIAIQAFLSAIFSLVMVGSINGLLELEGEYRLSFFAAYPLTLIFSLLFSGLFILLAKLSTLIFKLKTSWNQVVALAAVRSMAVIPCTVLGCVLFLINAGLGITVFYGSVLLVLCFLLEAFKGIDGFPEKARLYTVFGLVVIFTAVWALIASRVLPLYIPKAMKDFFDIGSLIRYLS